MHLQDAYKTIIKQHPYPEKVKQLLSEALLATILLTGSIKFEGEISLQFHGDERLPLLLAQCDNQLNVRAFAKYQKATNKSGIDYQNAFLNGKMVLTINQYNQTQVYQSIVPILSVSMSENLMHYLAQSEQLSSHVMLTVGKGKASGMLLQLMPSQDSKQREQFWEYAIHIGNTLTPYELLTLDNKTILTRLYHETELRLYPERFVKFRCSCSLEKMQQVLKTLGTEETEKLLQQKGFIEMHCEFCNRQYIFDAIDIGGLSYPSSSA